MKGTRHSVKKRLLVASQPPKRRRGRLLRAFFSNITCHSSLYTRYWSPDKGFTLIELMIAVTILVILSGTAYTTFNMALNVYQRETIRMIMTQNCRNAVNQIVRDLSNMYIVEGDKELQFMAEDVPAEKGGQDTITFVTVVDPRPDPFVAQLSNAQQTQDVTKEGTIQAQPDLIRVFYYLKTDEEELSKSKGSYSEQPPLSLFRATTTTLPLEDESIGDILETGTTTTTITESGGEQPQIDEVAIANYVQSLDFKYSDGEEWYESWDDTERPPKAVQVIVTVTDASGKGKSFTQSTMVYLTLTANFSEQGAGAQSGGTGGMPAGGGR